MKLLSMSLRTVYLSLENSQGKRVISNHALLECYSTRQKENNKDHTHQILKANIV
jgi:hypothetical protein